MFSFDTTALVAMCLAVGAVLAMTGVWVYSDARAHVQSGRPVRGAVGALQLETPAAWLVACVLLPEVALLEYVDCRAGVQT